MFHTVYGGDKIEYRRELLIGVCDVSRIPMHVYDV